MIHLDLQQVSLHYPVFKTLDVPTEQSADIHNHAGAMMKSQTGKIRYIEALKDITFRLDSGDRLGLIGRNGSGKSTLLRVLGGIYEPTSGFLSHEGKIAPLFNVGLGTRQDSTGRQNIILRGLLQGLSRKEAKSKIPEIEEFSGLGQFLDMPVKTYSSGMAMRLSFAIATAFDPEILLLDEWIGAGDADFKDKAQERMQSFVGRAGITVVASHNRGLLRRVCDHGAWLDRGRLRAYGPIDQVYEVVDEWKRRREKALKDNTPIADDLSEFVDKLGVRPAA